MSKRHCLALGMTGSMGQVTILRFGFFAMQKVAGNVHVPMTCGQPRQHTAKD
jgi:hypothetical protein